MRAIAVLVVFGQLVAVPLARAASGPCDDPTDCVAGQVCRVVGTGVCTWEATDAQTLIDAIVAAHADVERDVIFIGDLDAEGGPVGAEIHLEVPFGEDAGFGPRALPKIRSAITIEGINAATSIIDIDADMRMFLLEVDPVTNRRPDLLLRSLTILDARPGVDAPGAGAVTVRATPTIAVAPALPELPILVADDVAFVSGSGPDAGAILNDGAPLRLDGCSFIENEGAAGAVSSTTGAVIFTSTFRDNDGGAAAAVAVPSATRVEAGATVDNVLQISSCTFEDNVGDGGAVVSLAATATVSNSTFTGNVAVLNKGGAVLARNVRVQAGFYEGNFAQAGGGAVAILDVPASGLIQIGGAVFRANSTNGAGGGVLHTGAPLAVDQSFFEENTANLGGAGLAIEALTERNGAAPDVRITGSSFRGNFARPDIAVGEGLDTAIDERGLDLGTILLRASGQGSALLVTGAGVVDVEGSCFFGNGAASAAAVNGAIAAEGNWWGDASGPATTGLGDLVGAGVTTTGFLDEPAEPCAVDGVIGYPQIFIPARLVGDATIVEDFRMLDVARGLQVLQSDVGVLVPDTRLGILTISIEGVNDVNVEGVEGSLMTVDPCTGDGCAYTTNLGQPSAAITIADNGDGGEGEGEGEGEECIEILTVSASALVFGEPDPATGTSTASLTVTNDSPCAIQLLRPFVQSGASQGFAVKPILQDDLVMAPGKGVVVEVVYTPPEEETGEEAVGSMRIETAGGSLVEISLGLAPGCACATSPRGAPFEAGLALGGLLLLALPRTRQRREPGLPKGERIP